MGREHWIPGKVEAEGRASRTAFEVSDVSLATDALPEVPYREAVETLLSPTLDPRAAARFFGGPIRYLGAPREESPPAPRVEACSRHDGQLVAGVQFHPLIAAVHKAFCDHRPLCLSVDMIWLLIAQGFGNHVRVNADRLRSQFARHSGKLAIVVRRDDFRKASPENPWTEVFEQLSHKIRDHIGETTHDLMLPRFSTTGPVETAASEIALLDAMRSYFDYQVRSICGIPRIRLEGSVDDWEELKSRARRLARFDLGWWIDALLPILDQFVRAARGDVDRVFWRRLYKIEHTSGGPHITGWITAFFPYLTDCSTGDASRRNDSLTEDGLSIRMVLYPPMADAPWSRDERRAVLEHYKDEDEDDDEEDDSEYERCIEDDAGWWDSFIGHTSDMFPSGLASVPFVWEYFERSFDMEFIGGFVGVRQNDDTLEVRPEIGWAVRELD